MNDIRPIQLKNGKWTLPTIEISRPKAATGEIEFQTVHINAVFESENEALTALRSYMEQKGFRLNK